ncbi:MAG: DUF6370 family protein [Vicinamibacterales bacterium]
MQKAVKLALAVILALGLLAPLAASAAAASDEVTMSGKIVCALCTLKKEGQKECQDVFVADNQAEYWMEKTAATGEGHTCAGERAATITGTVSEKDGKKWIAASKITDAK